MRKITVFTPTYNRSHTLPALYDSLCQQTEKNFVWLIVDDGSNDNTREICESWIAENRIEIRYEWQENGGKMRAHNRGVLLTETELFVCVDSDDTLMPDSIRLILNTWQETDDMSCAGIIAYRTEDCKKPIGTEFIVKPKTTVWEQYHLGFRGDTTLIYRTSVLKTFLFPEIEGEKFITEAYIYNQIDQKYWMKLLPVLCIVSKYLPDGYTKQASKLYLSNPLGWALYHGQCSKYEKTLIPKIKNMANYIAFAQIGKQKRILRNSGNPLLCLFCYPLAFYLRLTREKFK